MSKLYLTWHNRDMDDKIGLKRGAVILKKHHKEWAIAFEKERANLKKRVGDVALDIQHVGSTSIPNLSAKPIVDILMAVLSLSDVSKIRVTLENMGYEYRENGSDDMQVLFVKGSEEKRTHYLHITEFESSEWKNSIAFRDYLRTHPEEVQCYEKLKQELAAQYSDNRGLYTIGKKDYFENVFLKAQEARK
jgi:GrpB-like predicted nucleotidyltransferase (UPF0157 family)